MGLLKWPGHNGTPSGQWEQIETLTVASHRLTQDFAAVLSDARWSGYRMVIHMPPDGSCTGCTNYMRLNGGNAAGSAQRTGSDAASVSSGREATTTIGLFRAAGASIIVGIPMAAWIQKFSTQLMRGWRRVVYKSGTTQAK